MQEGQVGGVDRSLACPFLGLADDRGLRLSVPDRRHRCFAEPDPAPRALAHQQQYCLQAAFGICPTFQDWARRESARVTALEPRASAPSAESAGGRQGGRAGEARERHEAGLWDGVSEWSPAAAWEAPEPAGDVARPVWGPSAVPSDPDRAGIDGPPADLEWRPGLRDPGPYPDASAAAPSVPDVPPFLTARRDRIAPADRPTSRPSADPRSVDRPLRTADAGRSGEGITRAPSREMDGRPSSDPVSHGRESRLRDWERPLRRESYPRLHVAARLPRVSVLWLGVAAVLLAALVLFLAPTVLPGLFVAPQPTAVSQATQTPGPSVVPSIAPTPAAPTQSVYVVVQGDTLSGIAAKHGLTVDQLLKANPQIKNPNTLAIGDRVTIPTPSPAAPASAAP
ncbi:MAG: LysM peptidoglycan-binding domain-containing protein [Chloroflexi bacterium]|nr:LysM peptidoglycan-binding domain-containing protein [Chloroflexota bacterium]